MLILATVTSTVSGQTPQAQSTLESILVPGRTVWLTDSTGREEELQVVAVNGAVHTTGARGETRRVPIADVTRVRARHADSLTNGAVIGAGSALASGLFLCTRLEPWANCRDDVGPMFRIGAVGAGVGIGIDALIRGRRTIYEAASASRRVLAPLISGDGAGLQMAFRF